MHLYAPRWKQERQREKEIQATMDAQTRAGTWREPPRWIMEDSSAPREIRILLLPDLPSVLVAGWGVVPGMVRYNLLQQEPGRMLPTTREIYLAIPFLICVWVQWYAIARYAESVTAIPARALILWIPLALVTFELICWMATPGLASEFFEDWIWSRLLGLLFWLIVSLFFTFREIVRSLRRKTAAG
jgi:hypothetical protein